LTRGRRRFSDTMRLSTAACHPGRPRLPDRLPAAPRQTSRSPVPAGSHRPTEPATGRARSGQSAPISSARGSDTHRLRQ
jgi:hypothetical protein